MISILRDVSKFLDGAWHHPGISINCWVIFPRDLFFDMMDEG